MLVATRNRKPLSFNPHRLLPVSVQSSHHAMALVPTAWGACALVWRCPNHESSTLAFDHKPEAATLCRILTPGLSTAQIRRHIHKYFPACDEVLPASHGNFHPEIVPDWFPQLVSYLQHYYTDVPRPQSTTSFTSDWSFWKSRLDWSIVTPFQRQVLEIVAQIPRGMHRSYGQIAKLLKKPQASRAVGGAVGANPWPVLVPCHRVLGAQGQLTGFSAPGGIDTKKRMLAMENAALFF